MEKEGLGLDDVTATQIISGIDSSSNLGEGSEGNELPKISEEEKKDKETGEGEGQGTGEEEGSGEGEGEGSEEGEGDGSEEGSGEEEDSDKDKEGEDKEGEEEDKEGGEEESVVTELQKLTGYEFDDEFEDSYEGIANYISKVGEKQSEEKVGKIFSQYPEVQKHLEFLMNGGKEEDFYNVRQQVTKFPSEVSEDDVETQKQVIREFYSRQGVEEEDINSTIKDYEDSDMLHKQSKMAFNAIKKQDEKAETERLETQKQEAESQKKQQEEYWNTVYNTVQSGKLGNIQVPAKEKDNFLNWMSQAVDAEGNTQRMVDRQKMDTSQALQLEYLFYKGLDLDKISKAVQSTQKTQDIKNRLSKGKGASSRMSKSTRQTSKKPAIPELNDFF